jgi:tRNA A-37 threonylcarbamoyl transferase component Bud32
MSESVIDTWICRNLTIISVAVLKHFRPRSGRVLFLTPKLCVKYGTTVHLSEARAMKLVAETTSVAVPKLYCSFQRKGTTYILMERIHGETIGRNWNCRTPESKADLLSQLRQYFNELRAIPHPVPGMVAAAGMTELYDYRIFPQPFGPFPNAKEFHAFLRNGITASVNNQPEIERMIQMQEENKYSVCFTHGDPSSSNFLVKAGKVVMTDFEFSGFMPGYWDYVAAMNVNPYDEFWKGEIDKFLDPYPDELEMERLRRKFFGPF